MKIEINSRWKSVDGRIFSVVDKKPAGKITIKQEGKMYFGDVTQKSLQANYTQVDKSEDYKAGMLAAADIARSFNTFPHGLSSVGKNIANAIEIEAETDNDSTSYCNHCGARFKSGCKCGPIPDND